MNNYHSNHEERLSLETIKSMKNQVIPGRVLKVHDGDTFWFYHVPHDNFRFKNENDYQELKEYRVKARLSGCDTPELTYDGDKKQPYAEEARDFVDQKIMGKLIEAEIIGVDKYGRVLCSVRLKGEEESIAEQLIRKGLAVVYRSPQAQYSKQWGTLKVFNEAEEEAKAKRRNIWSEKNPETPSEFRRRIYEERHGIKK